MNEFPGQFDRRTFIASAGAVAFALAAPALPAESVSTHDSIIVSPNGTDDAPGSLAHPLRSLDRALALSRSVRRSTILLRAGTYKLMQPLHITAASAPFQGLPHASIWRALTEAPCPGPHTRHPSPTASPARLHREFRSLVKAKKAACNSHFFKERMNP
jgi:hypothetical protein